MVKSKKNHPKKNHLVLWESTEEIKAVLKEIIREHGEVFRRLNTGTKKVIK